MKPSKSKTYFYLEPTPTDVVISALFSVAKQLAEERGNKKAKAELDKLLEWFFQERAKERGVR